VLVYSRNLIYEYESYVCADMKGEDEEIKLEVEDETSDEEVLILVM
jgi:hypothetical protein